MTQPATVAAPQTQTPTTATGAAAAADVTPQAPETPAAPEGMEKVNASVEKARAAAKAKQQERQRVADLERRAQMAEQRAAEQERKNREYEEWQRGLRSKPLDAMRALGIKPTDIQNEALKENTPEAKYEALERRLQEYEQREQERQRAELTHKQQENLRAAEAALMKTAGDEATYPTLAAAPPRIVLAAAKDVIQEAFNRTGIWYKDNEVLEYLEQQWSSHQKTRGTKASENRTPPGTEPSPKSVTSRTAPPKRPAPKTEEIDPSLPEHVQRRLLAEQYKKIAR